MKEIDCLSTTRRLVVLDQERKKYLRRGRIQGLVVGLIIMGVLLWI